MKTRQCISVLAVAVAVSAAASYYVNSPTDTSTNNNSTVASTPQSDTVADISVGVLTSDTTSTQVADLSSTTFSTNTAGSTRYNHHLSYADTPQARQIIVSDKSYDGVKDAIFRDGFGREALFRGWNVSGAVKLKSMNFMPFKNASDAAQSFGIMGQKMGANQIRFTVAWEGIHPAPDVIDYDYLAAITAQMKEAIKHRMYIVVDFHSDLYTRHTFTKNSNDTGNGAPKWIVKGGNHGTDNCGLSCLFTWGAHKLSDGATRSAIRAFWLNKPISTNKGTRYVQDEFLWQLGKVVDYLNTHLTAVEKDYILGLEPLNEPFDGGIKELGLRDYSEFDKLILWPFYQRVRQVMDNNGMADKLVYAEPLVFWYTTTGIVAPETGYGYLDYAPGKRFVFAPHMYDQGRMGVNESSWVNNAAYLHKQDEVRKEGRRLGMPLFLGEYGMWNTGTDRTDTSRIINASIQALETSNGQTTDVANQTVATGRSDRFADFYTPFINGTQWHWNYYYGNSREYQNDNPNKLITQFDAWNNENFSVIKDYGRSYTQAPEVTERIYPRRSQGDLMHFAYHAKVVDRSGRPLNWHSLRLDLADQFENREYFRDRKFAIMVWRGRQADAPTELFIPNSFTPNKTTVLTDKQIVQGLAVTNTANNTANEVLLVNDPAQWSGSGYNLLVWDDVDSDENSTDSIHYAVVVEHAEAMDLAELKQLQQALNQRLLKEQQSALYLPSEMTVSGYQPDTGATSYFQLIEQRDKRCMDVQFASTTDGNRIQSYACNGSTAQRWQYDSQTEHITSQLDTSKCLTVAGMPKQGSVMEIRSCSSVLDTRQQFVRSDNWGWVLTANPQLKLDSFGGLAAPVGLWQVHGGANQQWLVRY